MGVTVQRGGLVMGPLWRIQLSAEPTRPGIAPHQEPDAPIRRLSDPRRAHDSAGVQCLTHGRLGVVIGRSAALAPTNGRLRSIQEAGAAHEAEDEKGWQEEGDTHDPMMTEIGPWVHAQPSACDRRGLFRGEPER